MPESLTGGVDGDGVHVLFADGSVWFLRAEVPAENLVRFFTIAGARQCDRESLLGPWRLP
jgi:prepilin-type processing-associated H-X9-DG protein